MADISFEDIHELLRSEKYSSDLQPLTEEQLMQINHYLDSKKQLLQKQRESALFENTPQDKLRDELENANRALRDFYDKREKKIITRAIFTARSLSQLKDTTNMLKFEEQIYDRLVDILKASWGNFFFQINAKPKDSEALQKQESARSEAHEKPLNNVVNDSLINSQQAASSLVRLKFTDDIPELLDSDLKKWGPFLKDHVAELPAELAELLLKQSKAVGA